MSRIKSYKSDSTNPVKNILSTSVSDVLQNHENRIFDNLTWATTSPAIKKISLLQGIPVTIYSYAAGIFRSNNKYNVFGLVDVLTYISRINVLSSLNIRPDLTFTFLNKRNIMNSYLATYKNGLLGSAINLIMNPIDFRTYDKIIDNSQNSLIDTQYDVSFDLIAKIGQNSLSSPEYFRLDNINNKLVLNQSRIKKYKSIIYGGIDYEIIANIINFIPVYNDFNLHGPDTFTEEKGIFYYYIDNNITTYKNIRTTLKNRYSVATLDNSYNDIFLEYCQASTSNQENKIKYDYGIISFFRSHPRVKEIYLPPFLSDNTIESDFVRSDWFMIYNVEYDANKTHEIADLVIILMPVQPGTLSSGKIGEFTNHFTIDTQIRNNILLNPRNYTFNDYINLGNPGDIVELSYNQYPKGVVFYTLLCGLDDHLSYKFLDNAKTYALQNTRLTDNKSGIIQKTFMCYFDGYNETLKSVLLKSNNSSALDYFNGIKKIIMYNNNNSFIDYNVDNIINTITEFVYNINEGKAFSINVAKNNPLSYNNGIIMGCDCAIIIYLAQLYYDEYDRIFSSNELFNVYYNVILNNLIDSKNSSKINILKDILNGRYKYYSSNNILDTNTSTNYTNLYQLNLNQRDSFFLFLSELYRRNIGSLNQKSHYKLIEFNANKYIDNSGNLLVEYDNSKIKSDFEQTEDKWYDKTHLYNDNYKSYFSVGEDNLYNSLQDINNAAKMLFGDDQYSIDIEQIAKKVYYSIIAFLVNNSVRDQFFTENQTNILFTSIELSKLIADSEYIRDYSRENADSEFTRIEFIIIYFNYLLLNYFNSDKYYQFSSIIDLSYSNQSMIRDFSDIILIDLTTAKLNINNLKIDNRKYYYYDDFNTTPGLLNFTIVDIFNMLKKKPFNNPFLTNISINNNFDIIDFSLNSINLNLYEFNSIIELLEYIFKAKPTNVNSYVTKHNIQILSQLFKSVGSEVNTNIDNLISIWKIFFTTSYKIYTLINQNLTIDQDLITYDNQFVTIDEKTRVSLFKDYLQSFNN